MIYKSVFISRGKYLQVNTTQGDCKMPLKPAISSNDDDWVGTHITFNFCEEKSRKKKTCVWEVNTINGKFTLGLVKWFPPWRKYAFFPEHSTLHEEVCLGEIAEFLVWATRTHKEGL
jgi:hypothetical protein